MSEHDVRRGTELRQQRAAKHTYVALAIALAITLIGSAGTSRPAEGAARGPAVTVTVSNSTVGPAVTAGFVGLASEYWDIEKEVGSDPGNPDRAFEQEARNLAPYGDLNLRIGGDSTNWTWWPIPGMTQPRWVRWTMTPTWAAVTKRLVDDLHAHLTVGINTEANSLRIASAELEEIRSAMGGTVPLTFELGNEPELYSKFPFYRTPAGQPVQGRPKSYSFPDITAQWNQFARALPRVRLAGPGFSTLFALPHVAQFLRASPHVSVLTVHTYPLKSSRCNGGKLQESQLFDTSSLQTIASELGTWTSIARRFRVPVRVDEMNSVTCGGMPNFSGTFGPALWALNILPLYVDVGVIGVNFQTKPYTSQNLIQTSNVQNSWTATVQPEYYGLLAFAQMTPPGSRMLRVSTMPAGLYAWAVRTPQHQTHVVVTNVGNHSATMAIRPPAPAGRATVETLRAASGGLRASRNVTLGGQTVSPSTGNLTGRAIRANVNLSHGAYLVRVAPASAAIVTFAP